MVVIPLTEQQEQAIAAAALSLGVETWELAVHILSTAPRASDDKASESTERAQIASGRPVPSRNFAKASEYSEASSSGGQRDRASDERSETPGGQR